MKKIVCLLLVVVLLFPMVAFAEAEEVAEPADNFITWFMEMDGNTIRVHETFRGKWHNVLVIGNREFIRSYKYDHGSYYTIWTFGSVMGKQVTSYYVIQNWQMEEPWINYVDHPTEPVDAAFELVFS